MLRENNDLKNGLNLICDESDKMFMKVNLLKLDNNQEYVIEDKLQESAALLLCGTVKFIYDNKEEVCSRNDLFKDDAYCLHFSRNKKVTIVALTDTEILLQQKENDVEFETKMYDKTNIDKGFFGDGNLKDTTKRQVTTILDYYRTPWSKMVLGEIINFPGIWSSYPPHWHPQPEVYFYKFDKPQGFGACFEGDDAYKIKHNSVALIEGGKTHPQCSAPGYAMYYAWMIPHLDGAPWTNIRNFVDEHVWVNDENATFFKLDK